jgi:3-(3-hydroxy-phenyl)propionate hydroxylase
VSPFGARGANSGIQDADNLAWKLAYVLKGRAGSQLLDSYSAERVDAADENILNSTRATDFITPKSDISRIFRDATLSLARDHEFARRLVNSGRLSMPSVLDGSVLNTPDSDSFARTMRPGSAAADAPVRVQGRDAWLLPQFRSGVFSLLIFDADGAERIIDAALGMSQSTVPVQVILVGSREFSGVTTVQDAQGLVQQRYDAQPGTTYLIRPDQHVCGRWRNPRSGDLRQALRRAMALS